MIMLTRSHAPLGYQDFLARFDTWPEGSRYELIDGELYLMTGGSLDHDLIKGNVFTALRRHFPDCYVTTGDANLRVQSMSQDNGYFPDCMVICDPQGRREGYYDRPLVIVEVVSPGSQYLDRAKKKQDYLQIPSLMVYLLIDSTARRVTVLWRREVNGWEEREFAGEGKVRLPRLAGLPDLELTLVELYRQTGL